MATVENDELRAVIGIWSHEFQYASHNSAVFMIGGKLVTVYPVTAGLKFCWNTSTLICATSEIVKNCRLLREGL